MQNKWTARSHPNIALIKYIGKKKTKGNIPENPSLSYELSHLYTEVSLEKSKKTDFKQKGLNEKEKKRFLDHWFFLKKTFKIKEDVLITSSYNFPPSCGFSSSSSSFSALTKVAYKMYQDLYGNKKFPLTKLSQRASGSSARSFYTWSLWENTKVKELKGPKLYPLSVLIDSKAKKINSSLAHKKVRSSLLFQKRAFRAKKRLKFLLKGLKAKLSESFWNEARYLIESDFWDMHSLFHTSKKPFTYLKPESLEVLNEIHLFWEKHQRGPWYTMDAGPSVHLFFKEKKLRQKMIQRFKLKKIKYL